MNENENSGAKTNPSLSKLSTFLRLVGSLIVIAAAVCFAAQKWQDMEPWQMCSTFLIFTVVIAFMGGACRMWFNDSKGAGALFAVAAAMVPVHFTQLGGFIMNTFGSTNYQIISNTPKAFHWTADSSYVTVLLTIVGVTVLAPVVYNAFKHLISEHANSATSLYLITNAVLLLPFRSGWFVLPATLALIVTLFICDRQMFKGCSLKDVNSLIVRIMLISVPVLLMGRMYLIYDHTPFMIGISLLMCAVTIFIATNNLCENVSAAVTIQVASTLMAVIGWIFIAQEASSHELLFLGLPVALIIFLAGMFAKVRIEVADAISYIIVIISIISDLTTGATCFTATLTIFFAIVLFCRSYRKTEGYNIIISILMLGLGLCVNFSLALEGNSLMPWIILSVVGISIVASASFFEKKPELFGKKKEVEAASSVEAENSVETQSNVEAESNVGAVSKELA